MDYNELSFLPYSFSLTYFFIFIDFFLVLYYLVRFNSKEFFFILV